MAEFEKLEGQNVLVTGGAGYIGSHTTVELLEAGCEVTIVDDLSNSKMAVLDRIEELTSKRPKFVKASILNVEGVEEALRQNQIDAVIHFAGLKAVGESTEIPGHYYDTNVNGTLRLLEAMEKADVRKLVFSSSATVYGEAATPPFTEDTPFDVQGISHAYGRSKAMIELMLEDMQKAGKSELDIARLRYFNPIGAHPSGRMGEDPQGKPNNLMPFVTQVAVGRRSKLSVFGNDYPTPDGTARRDYIHVQDLANGHLATLNQMFLGDEPSLRTYNFGTGTPYSVLEVVEAFKKASGKDIPYEITDRRPGDVAETYAVPTKAQEELGWKAKYDLDDMCKHSWNWQKNNPEGYPDE